MDKLKLLGLNQTFEQDFAQNLVIMGTNLEIFDLKYRTIKITAFVKRKANYVQLLKVRKSYFYDRSLYINAFDLQGRLVSIPTQIYHLT